jgi:3-methyladenine DNA glycosylase AlkD
MEVIKLGFNFKKREAMKPDELYRKIHKYCKQNINETNIKKYSRYFKEGFDAYGLSQEQMDEITDIVLADKNISLNLAIETSKLLVETGKYEETNLAVRFVRHYSKQFDRSVFFEIENWFGLGIHNWAHCDIICGELLSVFLLKEIITFKNLAEWKTSKNKFQRRAVPVSFIKLIKVKKNHTELFNFIDSMMMDKEREVHQGLGWFLREAWKLNNEETEAFLMKWKNKAPRLIFQYATEKMTKEEKLRFKKEK